MQRRKLKQISDPSVYATEGNWEGAEIALGIMSCT
jgi:hypothetical protein